MRKVPFAAFIKRDASRLSRAPLTTIVYSANNSRGNTKALKLVR